jgi:hypothetical protein
VIIIIDFHQADEDLQVQMAALNDRRGGAKLCGCIVTSMQCFLQH